MIYKNNTTGETYHGGAITRRTGKALFSGIPTQEQLTEWGFTPYTPPTPQEPTADERREQRMQEILAELAETDYLALKAFEGEDMSEHPDWKEQRAALRAEYRQLESEVEDV